MEAIALLKEAEQMIKELQDAYVHHDGAVALRRKIRKLIASQQSVHTDAPKPFVNHCKPVNGVHAPFCNGDHSARG